MSKAIEPAVSDSLAPSGLDAPGLRASGFVTQGSSRSVVGAEEAIREANADLQKLSGDQLVLPLAVALEQRDEAYRQLSLERQSWQTQHKTLVSKHAAELLERDTTLDTLRQELRAAERELATLRDDPKTVIGVGPVSTRAAAAQASDSGEHRLQISLESAWQDVQDLRSRLAALELERDDAIREADDLRIEVYSKLATVRDEAVDLEARLVESQRALASRDEHWDVERQRLTSEVEEVRQALHAQVQANIELRRAIASGLPVVNPDAAAAPTSVAAVGVLASIPPVQTSADAFERAPSFAPTTQPATPQADGWAAPAGQRFGVPEAAPAPSFASLVGFDTSPPDAADPAFEAASALDQELQEVNRRSRGFGLSRLFQRTK